MCGGRDTDGNIRDDCLAYNITSNTREEASCTLVGDKMFVLGGIVEGEQSSSVEIWDDQVQQWTSGPDMPETRAHFCAVPIDRSRLLTLSSGSWPSSGGRWTARS